MRTLSLSIIILAIAGIASIVAGIAMVKIHAIVIGAAYLYVAKVLNDGRTTKRNA